VCVIVASVAQGLTRQDIINEYPQLKDEDITAALLYASESVHQKFWILHFGKPFKGKKDFPLPATRPLQISDNTHQESMRAYCCSGQMKWESLKGMDLIREVLNLGILESLGGCIAVSTPRRIMLRRRGLAWTKALRAGIGGLRFDASGWGPGLYPPEVWRVDIPLSKVLANAADFPCGS